MDFDWGDIGKISYLVPVIVFLLFNVLFKKQQEQKRRVAAVKSLLSEIEHNKKLIESLYLGWQTKKFKTATWKRNKDKMDYIDKGLYLTLADVYEIADGFNQEIDKAMRYKSTSYLASIKIDRLTEPLAKSNLGLLEWLELNKDKTKTSTQTP
ncbi:hypothetical protein ACFLVX_03820 [Chloroflexota bacterium]